ncbi:MupA/Atu3671 family FMN-dependent luciferase-like monooxygenase [Actinosynnema sp. NPDC047251]|uniref:Luciferase-like monooxygenase n=1 Tax=Saccharothrix espanaensis (strain ATCC 51144 / DSM 44229 / JCM 9112 / NBRC 15066 / NRRL 15764) TaxID=1179773 RepID=K0JSW5_SACES|nr:MupA/Atu3671 family FMN-dependent luciferase-like monooxygenase [Saccharothrix espanaensis]CCH30845.1 Luciferase-like monooxygenase [Saccharothrix espanaensis DSM 44229]
MDFSLFYFANDSAAEGDRYRLLLEGAKFADANGFSAVWTPERHFHPFGGLYPNPAVTSAAIAAVTERVQIRAGSVVAPLHHPLRIAEEWSVVDNLSGGRVGVSFASGWHADDYVLRPENYQDRRQLLVEHVETVRSLWRGESATFTNGVGEPKAVKIFPPPVQRELPVWVTSAGGVETFRAAGRLGAGVLTHLLDQDLDGLAEKLTEYRKALAERPGADGWPGHVALMIHTYLDDDEDRARELVRAPLSDYMRSSLHLLLNAQLDGRRKIDVSKLSDEDTAFMVERAFDRYFDFGLLGTVPKAAAAIEQFRSIGVDEVACLIDFGLPADSVLSGLVKLDELRRAAVAG